MGRPPTNPKLNSFIKKNVRDPSGGFRSGQKLQLVLKKWATRNGIPDKDIPTVRQIDRIKQPVVAKIKSSERPFIEAIDIFRWPDSMGTEQLPWQASTAALEFLTLCSTIPFHGRPTVADVVQFWQLRLAAPDAPLDVIQFLYGMLQAREYRPGAGRIELNIFECFIATKGWRITRGNFRRFLSAMTTPVWELEDLSDEEEAWKKKLMDDLAFESRQARWEEGPWRIIDNKSEVFEDGKWIELGDWTNY
jgi:hypothetical protein